MSNFFLLRFNETFLPLVMGIIYPLLLVHFYPLLLGHFTPCYWDILPLLIRHFYPLLWGHFTPCYCDIFPLFIGIFNFVLFIYFSHLHVCDGVSHNFLGQLFDPSGDFQNCLDSVCVGQHQRFVHQWKNLWWTPSREKKTQI